MQVRVNRALIQYYTAVRFVGRLGFSSNFSYSTVRHVNVHPQSFGPTLKLFLSSHVFWCFVMSVSQHDPSSVVAQSVDASANIFYFIFP